MDSRDGHSHIPLLAYVSMEQVLPDFPYVVRARLGDLDEHKAEALRLVLSQHASWSPPEGEHNFHVRSEHPFFSLLYDRLLATCAAYFLPLTAHPSSSRRCWAYVQTSEVFSPVWHDHLNTSTVNGVYYLSVPDPEGQIWFQHLERVFRVTPEEGFLYLFPRWLAHKPVAQSSRSHRVSLNIELITNEYPIVRETGLRW